MASKSQYSQLNDEEWLRRRYLDEFATQGQIAAEVGCNPRAVERALKRFAVPMRRRGTVPRPPIAKLKNRRWLERQLQHRTLRHIADELGCSHHTVHRAAVALGIDIPRRQTYQMTVDKSAAVKAGLRASFPEGRHGPRAGNWKGGRIKRGGYVWLYAPDHPRAIAQGKAHVQEHILVMEKKLGRYLEPGERVEHDDGVKDNNHPSNLKLMGSDAEHIRQHFGYGERTRQAERKAKELATENRRLKREVRALKEKRLAINAVPQESEPPHS